MHYIINIHTINIKALAVSRDDDINSDQLHGDGSIMLIGVVGQVPLSPGGYMKNMGDDVNCTL